MLALGLVLAGAGAALRPGAGDGSLRGYYGPAEGRYDPVNDTTLLVRASCSHCSPESAYVVEGDARGLFTKDRFFLRSEAEDPFARVSVAPYTTRDGFLVDDAYAGPFAPADAFGRLALLVFGLSLAGIGLALWLDALGYASRASSLMGALAGLGWGWMGATLGEGGLMVVLLAFPLVAVGLLLAAFRRTRRHAASVLLVAIVSLPALALLHAFYPSPPAL